MKKRIIATLLGLIVLVSICDWTIRTEAAQAVPAAACKAHTSTQRNQNSWRYNSTFDWHYTQRLYTTPGCNQIYIRSDGWRFNAYQCGQMWVRRYNADGSSYVVEGSRREVCGQNTVMLISRIASDRGFRVEGFPYNQADRENPDIWPVGSVLY